MKLFVILMLISLPLSASAQLSQEQIVRFMTNGSIRNWQFKSYKKSLGAECSGDGQLYTFQQNGTMQRRKCVNGKKDFKTLKWRLEAVNTQEWQLVLSEPLDMEDGSSIKKMRVYLPLPQVKVKGKIMRLQLVPECKGCTEVTLSLTSID